MRRPSRRRNRAVVVALAAVFLAYGWLASAPRPFTPAADVAVFLPALALVAGVALQARRSALLPALLRRRPMVPGAAAATLRRAFAWFGVGAAVVALELVELFSSPRRTHPTVSSLMDPTFALHPERFAYFVAWLALGAFLATR